MNDSRGKMKSLSGNQMIRWQMSLRRLFVIVALTGCGIGLLGRYMLYRDRYTTCFTGRITVQGIWKGQLGSPQLSQMVVYPAGVGGHYMQGGTFGLTPGSNGVSLLPEGMYFDGVRVESDSRVYVMSSERQLIPIELSPQELSSLTPEAAEDISQAAAWPKIKGIYEAEAKASLQKEPAVIRSSRSN